jgi:guanylate kinase
MTIVSLTGASGVGKSTLEDRLVEYFGGGLAVRTTTRHPRSPNEPGHEFIGEAEMAILPSRERCVLPPVVVHGNWYAAKEQSFFDALEETTGRFAIMCVTPERHRVLREHFAPLGIRTLAIHLLSPTEDVLRQRLAERNWTDEELEFRIQDSKHFDDWARQEGDVHFLQPDSKENIFNKCLELILAT